MAKKTISWPLAPAPGSKDHFTLKSEYDLFIGGKWVKPKSGTRSTGSGESYFDIINPANEQKIARIAEANAADVDAAVKAAQGLRQGSIGAGPRIGRGVYFHPLEDDTVNPIQGSRHILP